MKRIWILIVLLWLASATGGAPAATALAPTWLRAARALAQMHYLGLDRATGDEFTNLVVMAVRHAVCTAGAHPG